MTFYYNKYFINYQEIFLVLCFYQKISKKEKNNLQWGFIFYIFILNKRSFYL